MSGAGGRPLSPSEKAELRDLIRRLRPLAVSIPPEVISQAVLIASRRFATNPHPIDPEEVNRFLRDHHLPPARPAGNRPLHRDP